MMQHMQSDAILVTVPNRGEWRHLCEYIGCKYHALSSTKPQFQQQRNYEMITAFVIQL